MSFVVAVAVVLGFFVSLAVQVGEAMREESAARAADEAVWASWRDDPRASSLDYREVFEAADKAAKAARKG